MRKKDEIFSDVYLSFTVRKHALIAKDERTTDKRIAGIYILTPESEITVVCIYKETYTEG